MEIIKQVGDFKIEFNGSSSYYITDNFGEVWASKDTERKAINAFNKILKKSGIIE